MTASWRRHEYIPLAQLGTTDDCGFSPFSDDTSTTRDTAFAKIRARVVGTALAAKALGLLMVEHDDEDRLLRAVAIQNANAILVARRRAEQELLQAKEALELKTGELAHSLAMLRATLESTTDGILVTDERGHVTDFNERYLAMWRLPRELVVSGAHAGDHGGDQPRSSPTRGRSSTGWRRSTRRRARRPSTSWSSRTAGCSSDTRASRSSTPATSAACGASATSPRTGGRKRPCARRPASWSC